MCEKREGVRERGRERERGGRGRGEREREIAGGARGRTAGSVGEGGL